MKTLRLIESVDHDIRKDKKGYRRSYEVRDDELDKRVAYCNLCGRVESSRLDIVDENGDTLSLAPNRKLMPSKWLLTGAGPAPIYEISRANVARMLNPLERSLMNIHCTSTGQQLELKNLTGSNLDLMFGPSSLDWYLVQGDTPVAGLDRRKDPDKADNHKGVLGKLRSLLVQSNWVLLSNGDQHVISGPAFLSMMLLHAVFTDPT